MFIKKGIEKQIKLRHTIDANAILAKNGKMVEWGMIADRTQSKLPARHAPKWCETLKRAHRDYSPSVCVWYYVSTMTVENSGQSGQSAPHCRTLGVLGIWHSHTRTVHATILDHGRRRNKNWGRISGRELAASTRV